MTQLGSVSFIDAIGVVFFHFHCVISKSWTMWTLNHFDQEHSPVKVHVPSLNFWQDVTNSKGASSVTEPSKICMHRIRLSLILHQSSSELQIKAVSFPLNFDLCEIKSFWCCFHRCWAEKVSALMPVEGNKIAWSLLSLSHLLDKMKYYFKSQKCYLRM